MEILNYFDVYVEKFGWKVIPILPNSKLPFWKNWNKTYNKNIARNFIANNSCNIGLLLGNIVDVEADNVYANNLLMDMTKNYPHPMYKSEKSIHHLFQSPDPQLTRVTIQGIEFRGNLHQSVLPPSVNSKGIKYTWIEKPSIILPSMPSSLINIYNKANKELNLTQPWCSKCKKAIKIHKKRYLLEVKVFEKNKEKWQCHVCRKNDIKILCRKIKKLC